MLEPSGREAKRHPAEAGEQLDTNAARRRYRGHPNNLRHEPVGMPHGDHRGRRQRLIPKQGLADTIGYQADVLVLPRPDDDPASRLKRVIVGAVAVDVALQLGRPPANVALRWAEMLRAAMPEAAVDEDGDPCAGEDNIGTASDAAKRGEMLPEAQPAPMQLRTQRPLHRAVRTIAPHHRADRCR